MNKGKTSAEKLDKGMVLAVKPGSHVKFEYNKGDMKLEMFGQGGGGGSKIQRCGTKHQRNNTAFCDCPIYLKDCL